MQTQVGFAIPGITYERSEISLHCVLSLYAGKIDTAAGWQVNACSFADF